MLKFSKTDFALVNGQKCDEHTIHRCIKLLESPIPTATATATATAPSQKAHFDNISGTKRGTIDPLVSKQPEKNSE